MGLNGEKDNINQMKLKNNVRKEQVGEELHSDVFQIVLENIPVKLIVGGKVVLLVKKFVD